MTDIHFSKMHGLGNDFVLINTIDQEISLSPQQIAAMADRHTGIGFDQLLLVTPSPSTNIDFGYRIFNADGSEAEQCGNGARCFAQFVLREGLAHKSELTVQTLTTTMHLRVLDESNVAVSMGVPIFENAQLDLPYPYLALTLGNPHCVLEVKQHDSREIEAIGSSLQSNPAFPSGVNVGFVQKIAPDHIRLRVYERGAGETLACGSGACAAVVAGIHQHQLEKHTQVDLPGGRCEVLWEEPTQSVWLTGPTQWVFSGTYSIK